MNKARLKLTIKRNNLITVLCSIFLIAVLVTSSQGEEKSPVPEAIKTMMAKMQEVKSFHYKADLEISGEMPDAINLLGKMPPSQKLTPVKINSNIQGNLDIHDYNNIKSSFRLSLHTKMEPTIDLEMEVRSIDNIAYLKLNKLSDLGPIPFNLTQFENQWIKFESTPTTKQQKAETQLTDKQIKQLQDLAKQTNFFIIKQVLKDELIDNVKTYHYKFILDKTEIKNFLIEINKVIGEKQPTTEELKQLDEAIEQLEQAEGELWIGKEDFLLYKAMLNSDVSFFVNQETKGSGKLILSVIFSNFNKPVNITAPQNFRPSEEVFASLLGNFGMQGSGFSSDTFQETQMPTYAYNPAGRRDPFQSLIMPEEANVDLTNLPPIQKLDVSSLIIKGIIIEQKTGNRVMVQTSDNKTYVLKVGDLVGRNNGIIIKILKNSIVIEERYVDYLGKTTIKEIVLNIRKNRL